MAHGSQLGVALKNLRNGGIKALDMHAPAPLTMADSWESPLDTCGQTCQQLVPGRDDSVVNGSLMGVAFDHLRSGTTS